MIDLQSQGFRKEQLCVLNPVSIKIGKIVYPVHDTGLDESLQNGKVHVDVIAFDNPETAEKMDAALIQIETDCSTPIQHWVGPRIYMESVVEGSGSWVGVNLEGEVIKHDFDSKSEKCGLMLYGEMSWSPNRRMK